ncbi:hypothetical protein ACFLWG_03835 [Chloroflexota bacterium]
MAEIQDYSSLLGGIIAFGVARQGKYFQFALDHPHMALLPLIKEKVALGYNVAGLSIDSKKSDRVFQPSAFYILHIPHTQEFIPLKPRYQLNNGAGNNNSYGSIALLVTGHLRLNLSW